MDFELYYALKTLSGTALNFWNKILFLTDNRSSIYNFRLQRVLHLLTPIIAVVVIYHFLRYFIISDAHQYEEFVKTKCKRMKKVRKHLKLLSKRYGNKYFCYLPLNHGTALPRTYTLFLAIKDVLTNVERPASGVIRSNLLVDLLHANQTGLSGLVRPVELSERGYFDYYPNDVDPLSDFNLDIMKCSRELIIQGVKDFDTMSTVYRVLEAVVEDSY